MPISRIVIIFALIFIVAFVTNIIIPAKQTLSAPEVVTSGDGNNQTYIPIGTGPDAWFIDAHNDLVVNCSKSESGLETITCTYVNIPKPQPIQNYPRP
jgi:hypothetical protein